MFKDGQAHRAQAVLSGPVGRESRLQAMVFRTPGMISGTNAAAARTALNGALVSYDEPRQPASERWHMTMSRRAYPKRVLPTRLPQIRRRELFASVPSVQLLWPTPRKLICEAGVAIVDTARAAR